MFFQFFLMFVLLLSNIDIFCSLEIQKKEQQSLGEFLTPKDYKLEILNMTKGSIDVMLPGGSIGKSVFDVNIFGPYKKIDSSAFEEIKKQYDFVDIDFKKIFMEAFSQQDDTTMLTLLQNKVVNHQDKIDDRFGNTPLHLVSSNSFVFEDVINFLLDQFGIDINAQNYNGLTPLHIAVSSKDLYSVNLLLKKNDIQLNKTDFNNATPLDYAILQTKDKGYLDIYNQLKQKGGKLGTELEEKIPKALPSITTIEPVLSADELKKMTEETQERLLFQAFKENNTKLIQEIEKLPNFKKLVNKKNQSGNTLLHVAILNENTDLARFLLQLSDRYIFKFKNIIQKNNRNQTPYDLALLRKNKTILNELFKRGITGTDQQEEAFRDTIIGTGQQEEALLTSFFQACKAGDLTRVNRLIAEDSFIVNRQDHNGDTALHIAMYAKQIPIVKRLLEKGAVVNIENNDKKIPLDIAIDSGDIALIKRVYFSLSNRPAGQFKETIEALNKLINNYPAILNSTDERGSGALHRATMIAVQNYRDPTVLIFLLSQKEINTNITMPTQSGSLSLLHAVQQYMEAGEAKEQVLSLLKNAQKTDWKKIIGYTAMGATLAGILYAIYRYRPFMKK